MPKKVIIDEDGKEVEIEVEEETQKEEEKEQETPKGLGEEEVQKIIERVRKEEKDKLYPKIEELTSTVKSLQESNRQEQEEKERIKKEAEDAAEAARVAKLSQEERTLELIQKLEEKLTSESAERERFKAELEARDKQDRLERYRREAIKAAGDEIISELVTGNSEEEIDRSVIRAKARYEEIIGEKKKRDGEAIKDALSSTSPSTEILEEQEIQKRGLNNIDQDKYMQDPEYRAQIQAQLDQAVNAAYGH